MKAIVINPPWETEKGFGARSNCRWPHVETTAFTHFPIYLGYLVATLQQHGADVEVLDCAVGNLDRATFADRLRKYEADIAFIETSTPTIEQDLENARITKDTLNCKIVLIGSHVSVFDRQILEENAFVDAIIRGEFEQSGAELCATSWEDVRGITYRRGNELIRNPDRTEFIQMDELPFPAWDKFELGFYDWALLPSPAMLMVATRGCPFKCSYCLWPSVMHGRRQRRRSPANIVKEIRTLVETYGIRGIRFDDDTFALNLNYVSEVCKAIIESGLHDKITWSCFGHTSMADEGLFSLMKRAGCVQIDFGVETGSGDVLSDINKGTKLEKTRIAIETCRELRIQTYATYMMGFPNETEDDIRKTIDLSLELDADFMQVSYAIPYPGTRMFDECERNGQLIYGTDWAKYDGTRPLIRNHVPEGKLVAFYREFWRRYFIRPKYFLYFIRKSLQSPRDFIKAVNGSLYVLRKVLRFGK